MNLVHWKPRENWMDPFESFEDIQNEMNKLLSYPLTRPISKRLGQLEKLWALAVDIHDTKDAIVFKADIPGLTKDQIDVAVDNNVLTIRGEKKEEKDEKKKDIVRSERFYGAFQRSFTLPQGIDSTKVNAIYKDGVLEVTIPKKEEAITKLIKVDVK